MVMMSYLQEWLQGHAAHLRLAQNVYVSGTGESMNRAAILAAAMSPEDAQLAVAVVRP